MTNLRKVPYVLLAPVLGLALSACGSSDAPSADDSPTPTVTVTESVTPSPTASASDPAPCRTTQLSVTLADAEGAAGSTYSELTLTNKGTAECLTGGYGGVSYAGGEAGEEIGAAADRVAGDEVRIVLQPGESASARLREVRAGNYPASQCKPTRVFALKVYPPNETEATFVRHPATGCANTAVHLLSIQPYVKR